MISEKIKTHDHGVNDWCEICVKWVISMPLTKEVHQLAGLDSDPVLKEETGVRVEKLEKVEFGEQAIEFKKQKTNFDCGQTCLEMLGYKDLDIKDRELSNLDIYNTLGLSKSDVLSLDRKPKEYKTPHMVLVPTGSKKILESSHNHWVIRVGDKVLDPARGVINADEFDKHFAGRETISIPVPFKLANKS